MSYGPIAHCPLPIAHTSEGRIGLQLNGGPIKFRQVRVKEL